MFKQFAIHTGFPLILLLLALLAQGCSDGVHWSRQQRENATHLLASLRFVSEAAVMSNRIETHSEFLREREDLLQTLRAAHWNAVNVEDAVLDKLHPQLYGRFRLGFQPAVARMIQAYENDDVDAAQVAAGDIREFMDWYRARQHTFRWWDEAMP